MQHTEHETQGLHTSRSDQVLPARLRSGMPRIAVFERESLCSLLGAVNPSVGNLLQRFECQTALQCNTACKMLLVQLLHTSACKAALLAQLANAAGDDTPW